MSALVVAGLCATAPLHARAQSFDLRPTPNGLVALGLWTTALTLDHQKGRWAGVSPCRGAARPGVPGAEDTELCDPARINALDRALQPPFWRAAAPISDGLLLGMLATPLAVSGYQSAEGGIDFSRDVAVAGQVLGATALTTVALKFIVRRPRPLTYDPRFDAQARLKGDARLSFPSGHTSLVFASASFIAATAVRRATGGARIAAIASAYGAATLVAYLRMASRRHFFSDVLAGAGIGTAYGWLIPELHGTQATTGREEAPLMLSFGGQF